MNIKNSKNLSKNGLSTPLKKQATLQQMNMPKLTIALGLLAAVQVVQAAPEIPNAGTLQQQINPALPATPSKEGAVLPQAAETGLQDNTPFLVTKISLEGNSSIDTATLYELVKQYEGNNHTITDLQQACKLITEYYRAQGYSFARAVLPQQEIDNGVVRIQIIEAKYGSINIQNNSHVSTSLLESTLAPLKAGQYIEQKQLDRALLLLTDIAGTTPSANIKPGKSLGDSDIDLEVSAAPRVNGRIALDDFGNRFINRTRLGGSANVNNLLGHGDVLGVNLLTTGPRLNYAQLSYDWLLNGQGTHLGASYASLYYKLGDALKDLDIHGTADITELWVKHPFIRSPNNNLYAEARYQYNVLKDRTDSANIENDRNIDSYIFSLNGDVRDTLAGGGVNSYQVSFTTGDVDFDDANAQLADANGAKTKGNYTKWNYNLNRLQGVTDRLQLWASITGQVAQDNLDPSQKMVFGGPYSVRAFDNGTVSGDNGTLVTLEARYLLGQLAGTWQAIAFIDSGTVEVNNDRLASSTGKNKAHLAGAGLGINWFGPQQIQARAFMASSVGGTNTLTEDGDNTIGWVEIAKYF